MLKIAVVTGYFPNSAEPWQGRSAYQIVRLLSRKADVRVFFPNARYPSFLKPKSRTYDSIDPSYSPPDVHVSYHDYPALPVLSRPFNGRMIASTLLPHVRAFAPDIILSFFLYPDGYAALKIAKQLNIPVVPRGLGSDVNRIGDRITEMHTRHLLKNADFLFTVSEDLRAKAITMGAPPEKIRSLVNGCDLSIFRVRDRLEARRKLDIDPGMEAVVYLGRMDVRKGLRELVEAAARLHSQRPNLHVYMVGAGPDRPIIESAIQSNHAAGYVHALHGCAPDEVVAWIAASDLVALPSYMEGCPNVVLEALASGRPVVATDVGGIPEIMNDQCGRLVPPRDPAALATALAEVLDETWDAASISAQRSRSWQDVADEMLEIFESVLSDRRVPVHAD